MYYALPKHTKFIVTRGLSGRSDIYGDTLTRSQPVTWDEIKKEGMLTTCHGTMQAYFEVADGEFKGWPAHKVKSFPCIDINEALLLIRTLEGDQKEKAEKIYKYNYKSILDEFAVVLKILVMLDECK